MVSIFSLHTLQQHLELISVNNRIQRPALTSGSFFCIVQLTLIVKSVTSQGASISDGALLAWINTDIYIILS